MNKYSNFVDYITHYHCANFRGDRAIHSRDLRGGQISPPPRAMQFQNSPGYIGYNGLTEDYKVDMFLPNQKSYANTLYW